MSRIRELPPLEEKEDGFGPLGGAVVNVVDVPQSSAEGISQPRLLGHRGNGGLLLCA